MFTFRIFFIMKDLRKFVLGISMRLLSWQWVRFYLAILMIGVLVEELVTECLGENGHKMFMEDNAENEYEESPLDGDAFDDTREAQHMEIFDEDSAEDIVDYPSDLETKEQFEEDMDSQSDFH
jgi:hypothetical protein